MTNSVAEINMVTFLDNFFTIGVVTAILSPRLALSIANCANWRNWRSEVQTEVHCAIDGAMNFSLAKLFENLSPIWRN